MDISVRRVNEKIILVKFKTCRMLSETLLRFQEYYESPKFGHKIFTLGVFRQWYTERFGGFTYYRDHGGFNFSSDTFKPFADGLFDPLTKSESDFLEIFKNRKDDFYVIGTYSEDEAEEGFLDHELLHALYYTNKSYKKEVEKVLSGIDLTQLYKGLSKIGYSKSVFFDEAQAYMGTDVTIFVDNKIWYPIDKIEKLREIASKYLAKVKTNWKKHYDYY